ncbi:MAG: type II toxin-antitoxin system RelE/ParE family toxin [Candidatus Pacebacteria bacterium]|nr:type II toxin-antitoxin system RelE/ParE family toxin [Candidatus Paceibacterota bacterium]
MLYNKKMKKEYRVYYYINEKGVEPVKEYIYNQSIKERVKIFSFIDFLQKSEGYLDEPYSKHIKGKIRELRIDFFKNRHRIMYFTFTGEKIILLSAFTKKTEKTPQKEIDKAIDNYNNFLINKEKYD